MFGWIRDKLNARRVSRMLETAFSASYYVENNPHVAEANDDPLNHYLTRGWKEGRNPCSDFDVVYYLAANPDVAAAGVEPFGHYLLHGQQEGRIPCPPVNNWVRTVYLHVGAWKTGSTSIQVTLGLNGTLLKDCGIFFPKISKNLDGYNHSSLDIIFDSSNRRSSIAALAYGWSAKQFESGKNAIWGDFYAAMADCSSEVLCLSGETIVNMLPEDLQNLKETISNCLPRAKIKVLLFIREHAAWKSSCMQHFAKGGKVSLDPWEPSKTMKTKEHSRGIRYKGLIIKLRNVFGNEHCLVYSFEEACSHEHGPVGFFLDRIGFPRERYPEVQWEKVNVGWSDKAMSLMGFVEQKCPRYLRDKTSINPLRSPRDTDDLICIRGNKYSAAGESLAYWREVAADDTRWLRDAYGIDYTKKTGPVVNSPKMIFDEDYLEDIRAIFVTLSPVLQSLVYDYCVEGPRHFTDDESFKTFERLAAWVEENFPDVAKGLDHVADPEAYAVFKELYASGNSWDDNGTGLNH